MIQTFYRGSVKDLLGPTRISQTNAVIFEYTDSFSVFEWGKMPDLLPKKGEALALLAAHFFDRIEKPDTWKEFSRSTEALALRKANRFGGIFNELGEDLQANGLRTHYLGVIEASHLLEGPVEPKPLSQVGAPFRRVAVSQVSTVKPILSSVLGRVLPDYYPSRSAPSPRLIPFEVGYYFSCQEGSPLLAKVEKDPGYLASLGYPDAKTEVGVQWDFPVLELMTKLETVNRPIGLSEALAISGLSAKQLQDILLKTSWVAGLLKFWCRKSGLELAEGKLEWGISADGRCFLVDAIGPDEMQISKNGIPLSKEFLRTYYRNTNWYEAILRAKGRAKTQGTTEWKRLVLEHPPVLSAPYREAAAQIYLVLANELTGKRWFPEAISLPQLMSQLEHLQRALNQ